MKIGIVGGGMTGLSAAYYLSKKGHQITLFEKDSQLGGLAAGVEIGDTYIEKYYHHIFAGDRLMMDLIKEVGLGERLVFKRPQTANFYRGQIYPFTSALDLLRFTPLGLIDRLRFGITGLYLKAISDGRKYSTVVAQDWLERNFGEKSYQIIWEPLLRSKFGENASDISMAWFWSRAHDRSFSLGYLRGGFQILADKLVEAIKSSGGKVLLNTLLVSFADIEKFDKIIVTTPLPVFLDLAEGLPVEYVKTLPTIKFRSALSMVLVLKKSFMNCYWLNVNDEGFPFVAAVEHTNFISPEEYGGKAILYLGSYLDPSDEKLQMSDEELLDLYLPYLQKINSNFDKNWLERKFVFRGSFAQPIVTTDYEEKIPSFKTPIRDVYLATMAQVYPQDRGMNQAVKSGKNAAEIIGA